MTDLSLSVEAVRDESFNAELDRLVAHAVDLLPHASEAPQWWLAYCHLKFKEDLVYTFLNVVVESVADAVETERLNSLGQAA